MLPLLTSNQQVRVGVHHQGLPTSSGTSILAPGLKQSPWPVQRTCNALHTGRVPVCVTSFLILNLQVLKEKSDQMQLTMLQKHFMAREMAFKMHHIAPSATVSSGRLPQLMSKLKPNCMTLRRNCNIPTLHALTEAQSATYQGRYGDFTIGPSDEQEVLLYRAGINVSAMSSALASFSAFFPSDQPPLDLNALTLLFSGGLLVSLLQIHIYLDPLKSQRREKTSSFSLPMCRVWITSRLSFPSISRSSLSGGRQGSPLSCVECGVGCSGGPR